MAKNIILRSKNDPFYYSFLLNSRTSLGPTQYPHDLKQSDIPEIGSQGVISEILSGKRQFNVRQIKLLSNRFNVSPAVFM